MQIASLIIILHKTRPEMWPPSSLFYIYHCMVSSIAAPNLIFNFCRFTDMTFGCGLADHNCIRIHYPRGSIAKLVIRFEARPLLSRGYFLKCSHLAIATKLHCPRGNESLLYTCDDRIADYHPICTMSGYLSKQSNLEKLVSGLLFEWVLYQIAFQLQKITRLQQSI